MNDAEREQLIEMLVERYRKSLRRHLRRDPQTLDEIEQAVEDISQEVDAQIEQAILEKDAAYLTPESDRERLDNLIWRSEITAARRQVARVDAASQDIANARIALYSTGWPQAQALVEKVRDSTDPSLLFDWSRAVRLADKDQEAHAILLRIAPASLARDHAARWWTESSIQARDALTAGEPRQALELVQHAGFTAGDQHTDQQFPVDLIVFSNEKRQWVLLSKFAIESIFVRPL